MSTTTFNSALAQQAKRQGMGTAARIVLLEQVRDALRRIAQTRSDRCATADDAQEFLLMIGKTSADLGNAAGSLFRTDDWEFTGRWIKSDRVSNHSREFRVWRLR